MNNHEGWILIALISLGVILGAWAGYVGAKDDLRPQIVAIQLDLAESNAKYVKVQESLDEANKKIDMLAGVIAYDHKKSKELDSYVADVINQSKQ